MAIFPGDFGYLKTRADGDLQGPVGSLPEGNTILTILKGKVALVTGGARGLGLEVTRQLGALGATVLLSARDSERAKGEANRLSERGMSAHAVKLDLGSREDLDKVVGYVETTYGRLDILINNAAVWLESPSGSEMPGNTTSTVLPRLLRDAFDTNFFALVEITQAFLPLIRNAEAGRIVNVSSILGSLALHADPDSPIYNSKAFAYNASKAAVNAFTIHLSHELRETSIKVNSAHPGWVRSAIGGESAIMDLEEGSQTAVQLATLDESGPTGGFFHVGQRLPW